MLHRSFKPAKCKTSLKLATSRIKLLKNKKDAQVKQLKRELAQLLESGQDQTARIRVEHVVREEKMMAAYDLIEIYCELIVARLQIIESQKNCPIDLREAVCSVIFATPRCADIPELGDVRKHFTAKYGKEFISAAIELRPECGVSRMLVEKLSATAPDGQTKIKILSAIAEEHNIKWEPKSFGEKDSKPQDELLNGPNTFAKASKTYQEAPNVLAPHDHRHDPPVNSFDQNLRSSVNVETLDSTNSGGAKPTASTSYSPEVRPSGIGAQRKEVVQQYTGNTDAVAFGRQNWNLEFKDATAAAQAAAESAELASMAARAAAELSSRGKTTWQHSEEQQNSNAHGMRDGPRRHTDSKSPSEHIAKDPEIRYFDDRNSNLANNQIYGNEHDNGVGHLEKFHKDYHGISRGPSQSGSPRSYKSSIRDGLSKDSLETGYSQTSISEEKAVRENEGAFYAESNKIDSGEYEVEISSGRQNGLESQKFDYYVEEKTTRQSSKVSSRSHSSTSSGDHNVPDLSSQNFLKIGEDTLADVNQENIHRNSIQTSSRDDDTVFFDEHDSDDGDYKFDVGPKFDEEESRSYFPSPGRESRSSFSPVADSLNSRWDTISSTEKSSYIAREQLSPPGLRESLPESSYSSKPDYSLPVTFDHYDSPKSDRNHELTHSESQMSTAFAFVEKGNSFSDRNSRVHSHDGDLDSADVWSKNERGTELSASHKEKLSLGRSHASHQSPRFNRSQLELDDVRYDVSRNEMDECECLQSPPSSRLSSIEEVKDTIGAQQSPEPLEDKQLLNQADPDNGMELKFGTLKGGFRNKGYRHLPYIKNPSGESSSEKEAQDTSLTIDNAAASFPLTNSSSSGVNTKVESQSNLRVPIKHYDPDTDSESSSDSGEESRQQTVSSRRESYNQKARKEVHSKSSSKPIAYFDDDSEEDVQKQTLSRKGHPGSVFSRRTRASPTSSETGSWSRNADGSSESGNSSFGKEKIASRTTYATVAPSKLHTSSERDGRSELLNDNKREDAKPLREYGITKHDDNPKPSRVEQPPSPSRKPVTSGSTQIRKASTSSGDLPSRENSVKKAAHVHPKLPDYDTIAARLQSLRSNNQ